MTVDFTKEQEQFIREQLASGQFASEADVIKEAVSLWQKQERDVEEMRGLFRKAHQRNAHLDPEATLQMIDDEIEEHRRSRNR